MEIHGRQPEMVVGEARLEQRWDSRSWSHLGGDSESEAGHEQMSQVAAEAEVQLAEKSRWVDFNSTHKSD